MGKCIVCEGDGRSCEKCHSTGLDELGRITTRLSATEEALHKTQETLTALSYSVTALRGWAKEHRHRVGGGLAVTSSVGVVPDTGPVSN